MSILFFDTETSGKWNWNAIATDECQPRLLQVGALVCDDHGKEVACFNSLVKPDGWFIEDFVTDIHGITQERADKYGLPVNVVMAVVSNMVRLCTVRAAFNVDFDDGVLTREYDLLEKKNLVAEITKKHCVMKAMAPICKIPKPQHQRRFNPNDPYKWPSLKEAYQHAFGKDFDGAHDAIKDIRATAEIYFWMNQKPEDQKTFGL